MEENGRLAILLPFGSIREGGKNLAEAPKLLKLRAVELLTRRKRFIHLSLSPSLIVRHAF